MNKPIVEQETLCDFCQDSFENISRDRCEGCRCNEAQERYFEENNIIPESPNETFKDVCLDDIVFFVDQRKNIPVLSEQKVKSLGFDCDSFYIQIEYNESVIKFSNIDRKESNNKTLFVKKDDAIKFHEEICTKRIIEIAKSIGSVQFFK